MAWALISAALPLASRVAQVHHVDVIDEVKENLQPVLDDEQGDAVIIAQAGDLLEDVVSQLGRDAGGRLIQQQQLGLAHEGAGDLEQFHLPAGKVRRQRVVMRQELHLAQDLHGGFGVRLFFALPLRGRGAYQGCSPRWSLTGSSRLSSTVILK